MNQCRRDDPQIDPGDRDDDGQVLDVMQGNFFSIATGEPGAADQQAYALVSPQNYTADGRWRGGHEARVSARAEERLRVLPGIRSLTMRCEYPVVNVNYDIPGLPVTVELEALSPIIPGDADASSTPAVHFRFTLSNSGETAVDVRLMMAQQNLVGWDGECDCSGGTAPGWGGNVSTPFAADGVAGLDMTNPTIDPSLNTAGTVTVAGCAADGTSITVIPSAATEEDLFVAFASGDTVPTSASATVPSAPQTTWLGGVVQSVTVPSRGTATVDFVLGWYFPNRNKAISNVPPPPAYTNLPDRMGNWYNTLAGSSKEVVTKMVGNIDYLRGSTLAYARALYSTTIPRVFLESAAGRVAVVASPTLWRTETGLVLGSEGNGCCPLNCSHCYGYGTLLERLFPELAKDMAVSAFVRTFDPAIGVTMRFGYGGFAIDGALASVIKVRPDFPSQVHCSWLVYFISACPAKIRGTIGTE